MKTSVVIAACLASALGVSPVMASDTPTAHDTDPNRIHISCYRGALKTVAWDRANSVFINDLLQIGYDYEKATVIAEHICRDEYGVRNAAHQVEQLQHILRTDPPR